MVLGRPLALSHVENAQWTSSHKTPLTTDLSVSLTLQSLPPPFSRSSPPVSLAPGPWFLSPSIFFFFGRGDGGGGGVLALLTHNLDLGSLVTSVLSFLG